jgi:uncharacterized protein (UPF0261 family)
MKQIDFEFETVYGLFKDSLVYQDNENPTELEIHEAKQARLDRWIRLVTHKPVFKLDENGDLVLDKNGNPIILE